MSDISLSRSQTLAILLIALSVARSAVAMTDAEQLEAWQKLAATVQRQREAVKSSSYTYSHTLIDHVESKTIVYDYEVTRSGSKRRVKCQLTTDDARLAMTGNSIAVFDGKKAMVRRSGDRRLVMGAPETVSGTMGHELESLLASLPAEEYETKRQDGKVLFHGFEYVDLNGQKAAKVTFESAATHYKATAWYAVDKGFSTLKVVSHDAAGNLRLETEVKEIASVADASGAKYFFPVTGHRKGYFDNGKISREYQVEVDVASIRINEPIDDSVFVLIPDFVKEEVYDADRKELVKDFPAPATRPAK